ncbi:MAG TPA: ribonuclease HII [Steroidobacteraceae bacterium]|nr:ribonuclease HII [Steroidobacteraceae bacterium]
MSVRWPRTALLAGLDEAGRGPLAGPVVAAAVILPAGPRIRGLDDSKQLAPADRERLSISIRARAVAWGLGWADAAEIDALNILEATWLAMRRALLALPVAPRALQVDGPHAPSLEGLGFSAPIDAIVGGDGSEAAIAAASILAKTWRDHFMVAADNRHPGYGFAVHKGYGTADHLDVLSALGPCPLHRRTFEPVRSACVPR